MIQGAMKNGSTFPGLHLPSVIAALNTTYLYNYSGWGGLKATLRFFLYHSKNARADFSLTNI